eukprot:jgi/Psemu1/36916/gm1.36916_g
MEPKTSYSKRNPDRFVGHNQTDLKGMILITEDATAKHYNDLKKRLETLGGSKYIPQVGSSIEHLIRFEQKDSAPTKPTVHEYSTTVTDPVTQAAQTVEVQGLKETLMDMYKEGLKKKADEWIQYQRDMEKMYRLTLGQFDDEMKAKLKVQDLCFQSRQTKAHPVTNVLRAIRKLLCTQQHNFNAASYVKMVKENLDVVKSLGGTLVSKATVSYELEVNPLYKFYGYTAYLTSLTRTTRTAIDHAVEQRAMAALIIEGSATDNNNLHQVLADNYALQQNNYPATSVKTLDMLVAFKDSMKPARTRGNTQTGSNNPSQLSNAGKQRDRRKDESGNEKLSLFAQQGNKSTDLSTDQHSRQLLMTAVESGEDFTRSEQTTYMFLNIGMLSDDQQDTTLTSSFSSTSTYISNDDSSNDSYDVPDLVPRTQEYSNDSVDGEDTNDNYYYIRDMEHLFIQSRSKGGVNPYWILLDSESSLNLIVNPELVNNIRQVPNRGFMNIHCNAGVPTTTSLIADLPGFGVVWFYANGLANVLSLALT